MTIRELLERENGSYQEIVIIKGDEMLYSSNWANSSTIGEHVLDMEVKEWDYDIDVMLWVLSCGNYQTIVIEVK